MTRLWISYNRTGGNCSTLSGKMTMNTQQPMPPLPIVSGVEFRHIPGYEGYAAGDDGTIWSCRGTRGIGSTWRRRKAHWTNTKQSPTLSVILAINGKRFIRRVQHLVLWAFVGPRPQGMHACQFPDKNRSNNRLDNLRWDTAKANCADKATHGTTAKGEMIGNSRLTAEKVIDIRRRKSEGETYRSLVAFYGVSASAIQSVVYRKTWKHV